MTAEEMTVKERARNLTLGKCLHVHHPAARGGRHKHECMDCLTNEIDAAEKAAAASRDRVWLRACARSHITTIDDVDKFMEMAILDWKQAAVDAFAMEMLECNCECKWDTTGPGSYIPCRWHADHEKAAVEAEREAHNLERLHALLLLEAADSILEWLERYGIEETYGDGGEIDEVERLRLAITGLRQRGERGGLKQPRPKVDEKAPST